MTHNTALYFIGSEGHGLPRFNQKLVNTVEIQRLIQCPFHRPKPIALVELARLRFFPQQDRDYRACAPPELFASREDAGAGITRIDPIIPLSSCSRMWQ
jgi:hypothetical protein